MGAVATPEAVFSVADAHRIDLVVNGEFYLLACVKAFLDCYPRFYREQTDPFTEDLVVPTSATKKRNSVALTDLRLSRLIAHYRKSCRQPTSSGTCLVFQRVDGATYIYDFNTEKERRTCSPEELITSVPEQLLDTFKIGTSTRTRPPNLQVLTFESWWFEDIESSDLTLRAGEYLGGGLRKRHVTIEYSIDEQSFHVKLLDKQQRMCLRNLVSVTCKDGSPAEVWDLHVGAEFIVLGIPVRLMQASGETAAWLDHHAKLLRGLKQKLLVELRKYSQQTLTTSVTFVRGCLDLPGGWNLHNLIDQVQYLAGQLAKHRPSQGALYQEKLERVLSQQPPSTTD